MTVVETGTGTGIDAIETVGEREIHGDMIGKGGGTTTTALPAGIKMKTVMPTGVDVTTNSPLVHHDETAMIRAHRVVVAGGIGKAPQSGAHPHPRVLCRCPSASGKRPVGTFMHRVMKPTRRCRQSRQVSKAFS